MEGISGWFGEFTAKNRRVEQTLLQQAQVAGQTCTTNIEEVLKLCRVVDPRMSEKKDGHVLKGIVEDVRHIQICCEKLDSSWDVAQHGRTF